MQRKDTKTLFFTWLVIFFHAQRRGRKKVLYCEKRLYKISMLIKEANFFPCLGKWQNQSTVQWRRLWAHKNCENNRPQKSGQTRRVAIIKNRVLTWHNGQSSSHDFASRLFISCVCVQIFVRLNIGINIVTWRRLYEVDRFFSVKKSDGSHSRPVKKSADSDRFGTWR